MKRRHELFIMQPNFSELNCLIRCVYTDEDALRHGTYQITQSDIKVITSAGRDVLRNFPLIPNCCAPMSALWAATIRDQTSIPTHLVAGSLDFHGRRVFGNGAMKKVSSLFSESKFDWDGHCWVAFGNVIGDISFFRTAYAEVAPDWLKEMVRKSFGERRGLILGDPLSLYCKGLEYRPNDIAADDQITGLVKGAVEIIKHGAMPVG